MNFIDLKSQYQRISNHIHQRMQAVLTHGHFILGPEVDALEHSLAERIGVKHCIAVANGTDALCIAMMALNIQPGDEIIMPSFNFIASAEMTVLLKAKPVFVDIKSDTYLIDPSLVEAAVTDRTKAIVSVDLFGQCADYDALQQIAHRHHIPLIADAAQSMGALYRGKQAGTFGMMACTSFYPSKPLGCYGDGGACFTSDDTLAERIRLIINHGERTRYDSVCLGLNSRLDTLQAAILLAKLEIFDQELRLRQQVAKRYDQLLQSIGIPPHPIEAHNRSVYAQYTIRVNQRAAMRRMLHEKNIPTAVHYPMGVHQQAVYAPYADCDLPVTEQASQQVLSLPMHPYLTEEQQKFIVNGLHVCQKDLDIA